MLTIFVLSPPVSRHLDARVRFAKRASDATGLESPAAMSTSTHSAEFERIFLPHLNSAYNLARLLLRNSQDAEDVVQEAYLRALRAFAGFRGGASRPWFLTIVRNTCFSWLRSKLNDPELLEFDSESHSSELSSPEQQTLDLERSQALEHCIADLPSEFREALVLREVEGLSYREIAQITGVPAGTVMSRLSRARARVAEKLTNPRFKTLFSAWSGDDLS
jgi:RNA polymerase sigma-70 factor (ECF subfamily)